MKKISGYFLIALAVFWSCGKNKQVPTDPVVASVLDKNLYHSELLEEIPVTLSGNDSVKFADEYINKWIKQNLLVAEAEKNLSSDHLKIDREIEKYRQELIIFNYKNKRFAEIINREISEDEIRNFYNANIDKYILNEPIVQVSYIIFPAELTIPDKIRRMLEGNHNNNIEEIEDYIFRFAKKYDNFDNNWIYLNKLLQQTDFYLEDTGKYLKRNKIIEFNKNNEHHLIIINNYFLAGDTAPIEFVAPQIKGSIINHEKLDFLREIKDSLYYDALKYDKFRVYN
ncbi:MAG: hypothetical protein JW798_02395 [Prolixibacteraceae bacterium]|nr:hypothetical protein [Prolixibacteraceae bacterium]